jgi:hypothetical protein
MSLTPVFIAGFEGPPLSALFVPGGTTAPTIQTTYARNGGSAARVTLTAAACNYSVPASGVTTLCVSRYYLYFASLPAGSVDVNSIKVNAATDCVLSFNHATGKLAVGAWGGAKQDGSLTIAAGQWYRIDARVNVVANPWVIDWQIDGVDQGSYSPAVAADSAAGSISLGIYSTARTIDYAIDDIIVSATTGDYPIGPGTVVGYTVGNTSGTHNQTAGDLKDNGGTNLANGDGTGANINEATPDTTSYIAQVVIRTSSYAEYIYATSGATVAPIGVQQTVGITSSSTAANTQKAQLWDGTSAADTYASGTVGSTSIVYRTKCWAAAPSTGAWTLAKLQASRIRWGFSSDITPNPRLTWTALEAAFPESAPTLKVRRSSAWTAGAVKVRRSSAWVAPTSVKVRRGGAWTTVT